MCIQVAYAWEALPIAVTRHSFNGFVFKVKKSFIDKIKPIIVIIFVEPQLLKQQLQQQINPIIISKYILQSTKHHQSSESFFLL